MNQDFPNGTEITIKRHLVGWLVKINLSASGGAETYKQVDTLGESFVWIANQQQAQTSKGAKS
jgi:hypothetical protein